jgi:cysteine synthase
MLQEVKLSTIRIELFRSSLGLPAGDVVEPGVDLEQASPGLATCTVTPQKMIKKLRGDEEITWGQCGRDTSSGNVGIGITAAGFSPNRRWVKAST